MTNENAIEILLVMRNMAQQSVSTDTSNAEALDMAIRALKNEQTDGDLISRFRDYQIEWLTSHNDIDLHETEMWVVQFLKDTAECFLKELPSAEKTAEWHIVGKTTLHYECSKCGGAGDKWDKFCKHCGARMGVEE